MGNGAKIIHNEHVFLSAGLNASVAERLSPLIPYKPVRLRAAELCLLGGGRDQRFGKITLGTTDVCAG
jgi:hypothetical protein